MSKPHEPQRRAALDQPYVSTSYFENADVKKMGRGKRSKWRCRSFRWLQRRWFHWVDRSFGSNLYWPGGCRKVGLPFLTLFVDRGIQYNRIGLKYHLYWAGEYKKTEYRNLTYIERENTERIVLFNVARRSKLVKRALCHPAKHNFHICNNLFIIFVSFLYTCHPSQHKIII